MKIDDRFLMVAMTIAMAAAYAFTKDPIFAKLMEYTLVASFTMFVSPTKNWLITELKGGEAAKAEALMEFKEGGS